MSNINDKDLAELKDLARPKDGRLTFALLARFLVEQLKINKAIIEELQLMKEAHNTLVTDLEFIVAELKGNVVKEDESKIIKV